MKVLARKVAGKYHIFRNTNGWKATALCGREYFYVPLGEAVDISHPNSCKACRYRFQRSLKIVRYAGVKVEEVQDG